MINKKNNSNPPRGDAYRLRRADYYRWVYDNKPDWQKF
jgi:hypothetical protein